MEDLGLTDALAQLSFLVQGKLAKHAAKYDLSIVQTRLLGILRGRQPTMLELARLLDLDKSSVSGLIDRAEKRGLVARVPSPTDRRATHVTLTTFGTELVGKVASAFEADIAAATSSLGAGDRRRLSTLASAVISQRS